MTEDETRQAQSALSWVKVNKNKIIRTFAGLAEHVSDVKPVTLFMAGSPGAGKTEVSKRLIDRFRQKPMRIDADEIRTQCPGYVGSNAHIFQRAANKGVNILYDYALHKNINVILDGTFAYTDAQTNIERSLNHNRKVEIFFVYQDPLQAWDFTKKREEIERRKVSREIFINAFIKAKENVNYAKRYFGDSIELNILIKDFEANIGHLELNKTTVDPYLKKVYTRDELEKLII